MTEYRSRSGERIAREPRQPPDPDKPCQKCSNWDGGVPTAFGQLADTAQAGFCTAVTPPTHLHIHIARGDGQECGPEGKLFQRLGD